MEVLSYVNNIWIRPSKLYEDYELPYLMVNDKAFYEALSYFKERYNLEVNAASLESTDDHGVALIVYIEEATVDFTPLLNISGLFKIGVEQYCDECCTRDAYLKLYIAINQEMENV